MCVCVGGGGGVSGDGGGVCVLKSHSGLIREKIRMSGGSSIIHMELRRQDKGLQWQRG